MSTANVVFVLNGVGNVLNNVGTSVCDQMAPDTAFPSAEPMLKLAMNMPCTMARFSCGVAPCMEVCTG